MREFLTNRIFQVVTAAALVAVGGYFLYNTDSTDSEITTEASNEVVEVNSTESTTEVQEAIGMPSADVPNSSNKEVNEITEATDNTVAE